MTRPGGRGARALLAALAILPACACAARAAPGGASTGTLRVFAAASLSDAFAEIARRFELAHPGTSVRLNLAGSQQLAIQIEQGAAADVFASADTLAMARLHGRSLLAGEPAVFARNRLVVIVPRANSARIAGIPDLARRGVKLVIGAGAVPAGRYTRELLGRLARVPGYPADFAARALANVVSEEENVRSVVAKVRLGEADAGVVYASDVGPALTRVVQVFEPPAGAAVVATLPVAVVKGARLPARAREFVDLVLAAEGRRILERHGLVPGGAAP